MHPFAFMTITILAAGGLYGAEKHFGLIKLSTDTKDYLESQYYGNPTFKIILCLSLVALAAFLVNLLFRQLKETSEEVTKRAKSDSYYESTPAKNYTEMISNAEFDRQKSEYTQRKIAELTSTPEYKKMMDSKGQIQKNWNWQIRQKEGELEKVSDQEDDIEGSDEDSTNRRNLQDNVPDRRMTEEENQLKKTTIFQRKEHIIISKKNL